MNIISKARKAGRERNKIRTTVFKLEEYVIDKDPRKSKMIGLDMMNKDENGNPKKVEVYHFHKENKTHDINEFANRSAMMHTRPGGLIRLSAFRVNADGSYTNSHMQRIAEDDGPKIAANQTKSDIGYMKGWVKVYPEREDDKSLKIYNRSGKLYHRANALVIPEDSKPVTLNFGSDTFEADLKGALEEAINNTPRGTKPMLMVRQPGVLDVDQITVPNFKMNAESRPVPLTKEEMVNAALTRGNLAKNYLPVHQELKGSGETHQAEIVPGFLITAIGMKWDGKSMKRNDQTGEDEPNYTDSSKIEDWISETAQRHALPKQEGENRTRFVVDQGAPQYTASILSYRVPQAEEGVHVQADMDTLGRDRGAKIRTSPNAGIDVKPNPYMPKEEADQVQATQTTQAAQATAPEAPAQPQPQPQAQPQPQPEPEAQPQPQPEPEPQPQLEEDDSGLSDETDDFGLSDFTEEDFGETLDDLEEQMASMKL